mgnify:CR=1 FL=1
MLSLRYGWAESRLSVRFEEVLEATPSPGSQGLPGSGNPGKKLRMMLQAVIEPILFGLEADEDPGRPAVPGNEDLFSLR